MAPEQLANHLNIATYQSLTNYFRLLLDSGSALWQSGIVDESQVGERQLYGVMLVRLRHRK